MLKPLFILGLVQALALAGCNGSKVPQAPSAPSGASKEDKEVKLGDAEKNSGSSKKKKSKDGSSSSSGDEDEDDSVLDGEDSGGGGGKAKGSSSGDDEIETVKKAADKCQKEGYYYKASAKTCDHSQKAIPAGDLKECTNDYVLGSACKFLSEGTKTKLKEKFSGALSGFQLKFCLQGDAEKYKFVAWKESGGEITTQEIFIPK